MTARVGGGEAFRPSRQVFYTGRGAEFQFTARCAPNSMTLHHRPRSQVFLPHGARVLGLRFLATRPVRTNHLRQPCDNLRSAPGAGEAATPNPWPHPQAAFLLI